MYNMIHENLAKEATCTSANNRTYQVPILNGQGYIILIRVRSQQSCRMDVSKTGLIARDGTVNIYLYKIASKYVIATDLIPGQVSTLQEYSIATNCAWVRGL